MDERKEITELLAVTDDYELKFQEALHQGRLWANVRMELDKSLDETLMRLKMIHFPTETLIANSAIRAVRAKVNGRLTAEDHRSLLAELTDVAQKFVEIEDLASKMTLRIADAVKEITESTKEDIQ